MILTSTANTTPCECCGQSLLDRYSRGSVARATGYYYTRGRANRTRIDSGYWHLPAWAARLDAAGIPRTWAGKRACRECYQRVLRVINE